MESKVVKATPINGKVVIKFRGGRSSRIEKDRSLYNRKPKHKNDWKSHD